MPLQHTLVCQCAKAHFFCPVQEGVSLAFHTGKVGHWSAGSLWLVVTIVCHDLNFQAIDTDPLSSILDQVGHTGCAHLSSTINKIHPTSWCTCIQTGRLNVQVHVELRRENLSVDFFQVRPFCLMRGGPKPVFKNLKSTSVFFVNAQGTRATEQHDIQNQQFVESVALEKSKDLGLVLRMKNKWRHNVNCLLRRFQA